MWRTKDLCFLTAFIQILMGCIALVSGNTAQCRSYIVLSDWFRNVKIPALRIPRCDNQLAPVAWYRFSGDAGTRMPSSYVQSGRCSTDIPGWVRGSHQTSGDNRSIAAQVCFDVHKNTSCGASVDIWITDCGGYYVYRLPRIEKCSRVYCGEDGVKSTMSTAKTSSFVDKGSDKRNCSDSGLKDVDQTNCTASEDINRLYREVGYLRDMTPEAQSKAAENIIKELTNITDFDNVDKAGAEKRLNEQQLVNSVKILQDIIQMNISNASRLNVLRPASNILDLRNKNTFHVIKNSSEVIRNLVVSLEDYGFQMGREMKRKKYESTMTQAMSNLELRVEIVKPKINSTVHMQFRFTNASFQLSPSAFHTGDNTTAVVVVLYYKTLHFLLAQGRLRRGQSKFDETDSDKQYRLNNKVMTASVRPKPPVEFEIPVRIIWRKEHLLNDFMECVFWKPAEMNESIWSTKGCQRVAPQGDNIICECNHLTAFASMYVSDVMVSKEHRYVLEIISTVGCSLSLLGIILTMVSHGLFWGKLHSKDQTGVRARVLMHLCVAVGMTDILAIIAGPAVTNKTFCTVVSVSLYFFVLSVFGWMLCEGIIIYLLLVRVFSGLGGRHLILFYGIGWGIPTIVVALSVGLVNTERFITEHACWFRASGPLLWIFVGLTGITILINIIIFILTIKTMFSSQNLNYAGVMQKTKAAMKATAVLLPLLGFTWSFGLIVFNGNTIVFNYLFAIFNSLQGFMIFYFHVLTNKQIHDAIQKERDMRKTISNLPNTVLANHQKCGTLSMLVASKDNNNKDDNGKNNENMLGLTVQDLDRN